MARKLRITVSVFFGLLTVALCMLWAVGYNGGAYFGFDSQGRYYSINWANGHLGMFAVRSQDHGQGNDVTFFGGRHQSLETVFGFRQLVFDNGWNVTVPMWFPVLVCAALSITVWHPRLSRFSLRTLLIATTFLAIVLGLGIWLAR